MFISVLDLMKIGIGPSSSHTMGPMLAAYEFLELLRQKIQEFPPHKTYRIKCYLKGSLAFTGKGHATDKAILLGLHGYTTESLVNQDTEKVTQKLLKKGHIKLIEAEGTELALKFSFIDDLVFDYGESLAEHPNGMVFEVIDKSGRVHLVETFFSIGGGFVSTQAEINSQVAPLKMQDIKTTPYGFNSASEMMVMGKENGLSIAEMKRFNEQAYLTADSLDSGLDKIYLAMNKCVNRGLKSEGILPGGLQVRRRAKDLFQQLQKETKFVTVNDWLCAYAMAVNEENAAGHMVVTAPTNGAAGVIPAILYYSVYHEGISKEQIRDFLLTAAAIGGIIKHRSSISGAEVGCQGEVGSASAMAAAGLCAIRGGTVEQVENAAEIALEHHLGMTCDPVKGLVQVPCIERNGFGAIKAFTAASLAIRGNGQHFMPLDNCIAAMKQTGLEMSVKFKETSQGGLAVSFTEC